MRSFVLIAKYWLVMAVASLGTSFTAWVQVHDQNDVNCTGGCVKLINGSLYFRLLHDRINIIAVLNWYYSM